jgi:hypothetical protein
MFRSGSAPVSHIVPVTAELSPPRPALATAARRPGVVPVAVAVVLLARLLEFRSGASPDEGGFLAVGAQWHSGTSLYGNYWVDRPPGLITIFHIADMLGGLVALRVIGALCAGAAVIVLASCSRRVFGRRAAAWSAVVVAALLITPLYGAVDVNGELLSLPFIALGFRFAIESVYTSERSLARVYAMLTGVAAVTALMIKQNMADVLIFAAVFWIGSAWTGSARGQWTGRRALVERVAMAAIGSAIMYALVMLWAMAHGTSPLGVYNATYPFRVKAAHVIATSTGHSAGVRLHNLSLAFLASGVPLLLLAFVVLGVRRSRALPVAWALVAVLAYSTVSILAGGSYWLHYLLESVPAVALAAGATSLVAPRLLRWVTAVIAVSALAGAIVVMVQPTPTSGTTVGRAISKVARPSDTMIMAFGDPDALRSAGLSSPYPYIWALPARVLDPDMSLLRSILAGPDAPTWIVVRNHETQGRLDRFGVAPLLQRYRRVGSVCGRDIYLLDGVDRPAPTPSNHCGKPLISP